MNRLLQYTDYEALKAPIIRLGCGVYDLKPGLRALTHSSLPRLIARSLGYED